MKIGASVILIFGALLLAGTSNALAWGHAGGGAMGGHVVVQNRPFVDHRFDNRRFFFAHRPFFAHRQFFVARPVIVAPGVFIAPPVVVVPPPVFVAPAAPIDPFAMSFETDPGLEQ